MPAVKSNFPTQTTAHRDIPFPVSESDAATSLAQNAGMNVVVNAHQSVDEHSGHHASSTSLVSELPSVTMVASSSAVTLIRGKRARDTDEKSNGTLHL